MPDLHFQVEESADRNAATPQLTFKVRIDSEPEPVHSIALRAQVQIEPVRRRYTPEEQEQLKTLFGEPERWSKSLHAAAVDECERQCRRVHRQHADRICRCRARSTSMWR